MPQFKGPPFQPPQQPPPYSQQPPYMQPGMYQQQVSPVIPSLPPPQPQPPRKRSRARFWIILATMIVLIIIVATVAQGKGSGTTPAVQTTATATPLPTATPTLAPTPTPTPVPTQPPPPTQSSGQIEQAYKASTTSTTVANLDKEGNNDLGKDVHFTATILNFVKDDSGNTAGANVSDPTTSGVIQVGFPAGTDVSQLNTGDTLEVWGQDEGTASGTNAFGATIQEVVISASYITDQATGYQAG